MAGAYVQSKSTLGTGVTSVAVTPTSAITAGSMLVACTSGWARAAAAGNVTDTKSNTYTIREHADGTNAHAGLYEALNVASGSTTITFAPSGGAQDTDISVVEFSGMATASAFDKSTQSVNNSATATQTTGTTAATTQAGEVAVGVVTNEGPQGPAWSGLTPAGWVRAEELDTSSQMPIYVAYRILSSTGTQGFTVTGASNPYVGAVATFKDSSGAAADPYPAGYQARLPATPSTLVRM